MNDWFSSIYKSFLIISPVILLIYLNYAGTTSVDALICGFVLLNFAILMILFRLGQRSIAPNESTLKTLSSLISNTGPFLLMFGVILFTIVCLSIYRTPIAEGHVSQGFNTFSNILIVLSFIQVYIIYTNINTEQFDKVGKLPTIISGIVYLFGVLSSICSLLLFVILRYYTTDG